MAKCPDIVKHMTLAIFRRGGLLASTKERFRQAYNIAVSQCRKYGYITGSGSAMQPTAKGMKHQHEGMRGFVKDRTFDAMFAWIMDEQDRAAAKVGKELTTEFTERRDADYNDAHLGGRNKKDHHAYPHKSRK